MGLQLAGFKYFEEKTVIFASIDIIRTYVVFLMPFFRASISFRA
jgi:hypothetical protein